MLRVVAKYANVIVLRHFDDIEARRASVPAARRPIISGGFGQWEHPTQALVGPVHALAHLRPGRGAEGLHREHATSTTPAPGHSMAYGLARLGAEGDSRLARRAPEPPTRCSPRSPHSASRCDEEFDLEQESFNELIYDMDLVYLPGCSAPKGPEADAFKTTMDKYLVRYETLLAGPSETGGPSTSPTPCPGDKARWT